MTQDLLTCSNLCRSFGNVKALQDVNLNLSSGKIIGLLGPNGSGKTTLIKILNGLLQPTSGEVRIDGKAPGVETKRIVSYLPDLTAPGAVKTGEVELVAGVALKNTLKAAVLQDIAIGA